MDFTGAIGLTGLFEVIAFGSVLCLLMRAGHYFYDRCITKMEEHVN